MKHPRLTQYASTVLGTTSLLATQADAATVVFANGPTYNTGLSGIGTVTVNYAYANAGTGLVSTTQNVNWGKGESNAYFQRSISQTTLSQSPSAVASKSYVSPSNDPIGGAALNSSDNWSRLRSFDGTQEVWIQFDFGNTNAPGGGIVKLVYPSTVGQFSTAAQASSYTGTPNVSAVPEPSSAFGLLALGASGLMIRRRIKAA